MSSSATNINELPSIDNSSSNKPVQNVSFNVSNDANNDANKPDTSQAPGSAFQLSQEDLNKIVSGVQQASQSNLTSLPSRDIPRENTKLTMDEEAVNTNFIPNKPSQDYIENNANYEQLLKQQYEAQKKTEKNDEIFDELKTPILISILYFIFQLPVVRKILIRNIPSLFLNDGNLSFNGIMFKSIFFGAFYFIIHKIMDLSI